MPTLSATAVLFSAIAMVGRAVAMIEPSSRSMKAAPATSRASGAGRDLIESDAVCIGPTWQVGDRFANPVRRLRRHPRGTRGTLVGHRPARALDADEHRRPGHQQQDIVTEGSVQQAAGRAGLL